MGDRFFDLNFRDRLLIYSQAWNLLDSRSTITNRLISRIFEWK